MVKTCVVAVVLATALAMAQSSAPSQNGGTQPANSTEATSAAQITAPAMQNGASQTVAATPDTRAPQTSASPADQALAREVLAQFAHKAEFQNVTVSVTLSVVTLEGSVPTKVERRQAKALARGVNGVKKVQEHLALSGDGVSGPGTAASTTTSAQNNNAGSISGNEKAEAGNVQGTSAMSQTPSTSAAPSLNPGTQPARTQTGNAGGITGAAVNTPPSSTVGAGNTTSPPPPHMPVARATNPQSQPQQPAFGLSKVDTASLASRINSALKSNPALANNNVMVNIGDQGAEVTGTVDTGKEKLTAMRIAQSYAGNFKVVDRITLAGQTPANAQNAQQQQASQPPRTTRNNPAANVPGNQVLPTSTANQARDPKNAGDKSTNPR
jgi:osmotically-inducible protein OsmY